MEFLQPLGITQVDAARQMGIPLNRLNKVIQGKRSITADRALRLARSLETTPRFWLNLQMTTDLYHAARKLEPIEA